MYAESVAMTGYAVDASLTFDVRIARFPEAERAAWGYVYAHGETEAVTDLEIDAYGTSERAFTATLANGARVRGRARVVREVSVPIEGSRRPGATVLVESDLSSLVGVLNDWQPGPAA